VGITLVCPYAWVLGWQAAARASTGALSEAFRGFDEALSIARERGDFETESWIQMSVVQAMQLAGGGDAMRHALQAQEIAERAGGAFSIGLAWRYLGIAHLIREEWNEAIDALQKALATWRPRRVGLEAEPHALTMLARAQLGSGDVEGAVITAQEAVTLAIARQTHGHEIEARLALVQSLRAASGVGAAAAVETHLRRAEALVEETAARTLKPRVHAELAELARLRGDEPACERELQEARRLFEEVGAVNLAERLALSV
jgi:tetratricopeptide (TPR) repeat protein